MARRGLGDVELSPPDPPWAARELSYVSDEDGPFDPLRLTAGAPLSQTVTSHPVARPNEVGRKAGELGPIALRRVAARTLWFSSDLGQSRHRVQLGVMPPVVPPSKLSNDALDRGFEERRVGPSQGGLPLRTRVAAAVGGGIGALSRATGRGSGSVVGGHAVLAIDPSALARLSAGRQVSLVSGTNGKTTTTKLLASALSDGGRRTVVTNLLGANLRTGLSAALAAGPPHVPAVLEVDEAWLGRVAAEVRPALVLLLNLSRDQLDRNNEVRQVAQRWRQACHELPSEAMVVANADDPLVAWAAGAAPRVTWVGAGLRWMGDATGCPQCGGSIVFGLGPQTAGGSVEGAGGDRPSEEASPHEGWKCVACGFSRPQLDFWLGTGPREGWSESALGTGSRLSLGLPGRCNQANALMVLAGAASLGADAEAAVNAMASVREVAGRYATLEVGGVRARLLLAKNPAGWAEVFGMLAPAPAPVVIAINARTADGHDPSWLWDVPFELLRGRHVVATGERGLDLAVRLHYAEVDHVRESDLLAAIGSAGAADVDVVANYTAFHQLLARVATTPARPPSL